MAPGRKKKPTATEVVKEIKRQLDIKFNKAFKASPRSYYSSGSISSVLTLDDYFPGTDDLVISYDLHVIQSRSIIRSVDPYFP